MQRLPDLFDIQRSHTRPMIRPKYDDLLMSQSRQHTPDIAASSAEHLRQAVFGKTTARINALFENGVENP
jgi:hypothetical protein